MEEKFRIIKTIQVAFGGNEYPGDRYLLGSTEGSEPLEEIQAFIGQEDWRKVLPAVLDAHSGALTFFSEAGLRFFLPAFLIADLNGLLENSDVVFPLVHGFSNLSVPHEVAGKTYLRKTGRDALVNPRRYGALTFYDYARFRLAVFSREEAQAIVEYLEFKRKCDPAGLDAGQIIGALNSFWYERAKSAPDAQSIREHVRYDDDYLDALMNES